MAKQISFLHKNTLVFCVVLLTIGACSDKQASTPAMPQLEAQTLLQVDAVLHQRLQAILSADSAYAQSTKKPTATATIDRKDETIAQAEIALKKTIDSLENRQVKHSIATEEGIAQLSSYFKSFLRNRGAVSDLRMVVSANSDDSTAMQHTLADLRNQLQAKDKRIAELEHAGNTVSKESTSLQNGNVSVNAPVKDTEPTDYAPAKGETVSDLKQRNKNLSLALSSLQNKYFSVGRDYLLLKQEHERTLNELAALRKSGNQQ